MIIAAENLSARLLVSLSALSLCLGTQQAAAQTAAEHLASLPAPDFAADSNLIPLTRWGWELNLEAKKELADRWGYAVMFGTATPNNVEQLDDPGSDESKTVALVNSDPAKYKLGVIPHRPLLDKKYVAQLPDAYWVRNADGQKFEDRPFRLKSPTAPLSIYQEVADKTVEPLAKLKAKVPVSLLLNGGEYGLSVYGHSGKYWNQDPDVLVAKGDQDWFTSASEQKAKQEMLVTNAIREMFLDRSLYLFYHFGGIPTWDDWKWSWKYKPMKNIADYPGQSLYYQHYNKGWPKPERPTGKQDLLTHHLRSVAEAIPGGQPLSYNWVSAGWGDHDENDLERFSPIDRYTGFLKCVYASGAIGNVAGYFSMPSPKFKEDLGPTMPHWLRQMVALSRVHAKFSHLDHFLFDGELLPGPSRHRMEEAFAAYEFPTGDENVRVLVRKLHAADEFLIVAWAATGEERSVTFEIADAGEIDVTASPIGRIYRMTAEQKIDYEPPIIDLQPLDD